eukprot:2980844-Prymnesium_polylepis.1
MYRGAFCVEIVQHPSVARTQPLRCSVSFGPRGRKFRTSCRGHRKHARTTHNTRTSTRTRAPPSAPPWVSCNQQWDAVVWSSSAKQSAPEKTPSEDKVAHPMASANKGLRDDVAKDNGHR